MKEQLKNTKICTNCRAEINDAKAEICPKCCKQSLRCFVKKDPVLAAILGFFFIGLGQVYNGQMGKGILFVIIQTVSIILFIMLSLFLIGFLSFFIIWIWTIVDAYKTAEKINAGKSR